MKSLLLKDMYCLGYSVKYTALVLVIFACLFIPSAGAVGFVFAAAFMCSSMTLTTFAMDEGAHWMRYAATFTKKRKTVITAKYVLALVLCVIGALVGIAAGMASMQIKLDSQGLLESGLYLLLAVFTTFTVVSSAIPLVVKYGAERARLFVVVIAAIPAGAVALVVWWLSLQGIALTDTVYAWIFLIVGLLCLVWNFISYKISCSLYEKAEL